MSSFRSILPSVSKAAPKSHSKATYTATQLKAKVAPKGQAVLGSFESWAEVIGGILEVCGQPGFLDNKNELTTRDDHALGWSALVAEWWRQYQTSLVCIDNLHEIIVRNAELEVAFSGTLGQGLDRSQKRKLGEELRRVEGRVFGSWRVEIVVRVPNE